MVISLGQRKIKFNLKSNLTCNIYAIIIPQLLTSSFHFYEVVQFVIVNMDEHCYAGFVSSFCGRNMQLLFTYNSTALIYSIVVELSFVQRNWKMLAENC